MIKFSKEKVLELHRLLVEETGGSAGLRDMKLLDSALQSAFATFDGKELYPTTEEKAARIGYNLIKNHAFIDGNKRTGIFVMLTFLEVNGIKAEPTNEELIEMGLGVASGEISCSELLQRIRDIKA